MAAIAATTITETIVEVAGLRGESTDAVTSAVSPGSGSPGRFDGDEHEEQHQPVVRQQVRHGQCSVGVPPRRAATEPPFLGGATLHAVPSRAA